MRKVFIFVVLWIIPMSALAEWQEINTDNFATDSVNISTIHKDGYKVKMWSRTDYLEPQKFEGKLKYNSSKAMYEYDCKENQRRLMSLVFYKETKGRGEVIYTGNSVAEWAPIVPDSVGETYFRVACESN